MPVTQAVLKRLARPLNRGDFPAFVEAVEHLPAADRNVLTVLGACDLLGPGTARAYLSQGTETSLVLWVLQFKAENVDELPDWPAGPDAGPWPRPHRAPASGRQRFAVSREGVVSRCPE